MKDTLARVLNRIVRPFGVRCVPTYEIPRALELPDRCLEGARIVAERADILPLLPKGGVVAEIGVAFGRFSRRILDVMQPREFVAIDTFGLDESHDYRHILGDLSHEAYFRRELAQEIARGQVVIRKGYSVPMLNAYADSYFDMIYVDAAHDYENVRNDLAAAGRKIKDDGYIVLNDYTIMDPLLLQPYGIVQATHELCVKEGWAIAILALHPYLFCDVALRKLKD